jgi:tol-pal system protein YbgF
MIFCKKHIIAACFSLILPVTGWCEAPVVDDSSRFAILDAPSSAAHTSDAPKYDEPQFDTDAQPLSKGNAEEAVEDGLALAKEDTSEDVSHAGNGFNDNAKLIEKVQALQQEIQELRGQLEVQAHDLKLLQQQQVAFYKDLDARIGGTSTKTATQTLAPMDLDNGATIAPEAKTAAILPKVTQAPQAVIVGINKGNPADEQISYLAAYELIKNKRYDAAIQAMQTFVQKYPRGGYTANAEYWLGELYTVNKQYSTAIEHFNIVLVQFPSSAKSAASLLKSGYAYAASGNTEEAKKRYQQVVSAYPNTPTAELARAKLGQLKAL